MVRVALMAAQGIFSLAGIALVAVALWQNNNTPDRYLLFMELFWLMVLGCALFVLALNTVVWLQVLRRSQSKGSLLATLFLLVVLSPAATFFLSMFVLIFAALTRA
jgi:hypothetical protein